MPNIASVLKTEIARVARKQLRSELDPVKKATAQYRSTIAALKRRLGELEKSLRTMRKGAAAQPSTQDAQQDSVRRRFSASRLAAHRKKLGLTIADYARLVGVAGMTIHKWENGSRPRQAQLEALASVRQLGKKEVAARLSAIKGAGNAATAEKAAPKRAKATAAGRRPASKRPAAKRAAPVRAARPAARAVVAKRPRRRKAA